MFDKLSFNINRVYPTLVVSTMSSGKSTLINALAGKDLLPSRNRACTSRTIAILDNDERAQFKIHAVDKTGKYSYIDEATESIVAEFNQTNDVVEMIIEGDIQGIRNSKKALLLVDTPGINNSMDQSHEMITKEVLDEYPEGLILYIINAQQIGTYDDSNFLTLIAKKLMDNSNFKIIFVINKMDLIDPEKEKPWELVENCKTYIQSKGIENPVLIPVSASSALIFKKVLNQEILSELEEEDFVQYYRHFKRESYSLNDYACMPGRGNGKDILVVDGINYCRAEIYAALDNTGVPFLEKVIDETLIRSLKMKAPGITVKRNTVNKAKRKNSIKKEKSAKTKP